MRNIYRNFVKFLSLDVGIVIMLTICVLIKSSFFVVHPLYFLLLFLSANYRFKTYLVFNIVSILFGFIYSYDYGFLLTVINSVFFLLKIIVNCFTNKNILKEYLPFICTTLLIYTYFTLKDLSWLNVLKNISMMLFLFLNLYAFNPLIKSIKYKKDITDKTRILIAICFPFFFLNTEPIVFLFLQVIYLIYLKTLDSKESIISLFVSLFLMFCLKKINVIMLFSLIIPFLITCLFSKQKSLFVYCFSFLTYETLFQEKFYETDYFYLGMTGIILCIFINPKIYENIYKFFYKQNDFKTQKESTINAIKDYINLVLSPKLEVYEPKNAATYQLETNLCENCIKKSNCNLKTLRNKSIELKLNQSERKTVLESCQTPYRFFKQSSLMREIYYRENQKKAVALEFQNAYKNELSNIYTPLMLMDKEEVIFLDKLKSLLEEEEFKIIDITEYQEDLEIRLESFDDEDISSLLSLIIDVYQKPAFFVKSVYSFSSGSYLLLFSFRQRYKIDKCFSINGLNEKCGDSIKIEQRNNKFIFLLSDGMGHSEYSSILSEYLIDSVLTLSKINHNFAQQIKTANKLLYNKSTEETYATLDYLTIDLVSLKFSLFKAGSFPNYIYHNYKIKESKKNFPPLGILKEIEPFAYCDNLNEGDVLVFLSDGFKEDVKDIIEVVVTSNAYRSAEEIHRELIVALNEETNLSDDKTLVVFKIEKKD